MDTVLLIVLLGGLAVGLFALQRVLQNYWEQETNLTEDDHEFDRRVADYNDQLAYRKRDDEIVKILRGRDVPTLAERYGINDDEE